MRHPEHAARTAPHDNAPHPHDRPLPHELEISFSTHLTVVVPARLDFAAGDAHAVELVLPRPRNGHRRPCLRALLEAAQAALARARTDRLPLQLSARIDGQWRALCDWPDLRAAT
jgi:hypothetical protein